MPATEQDKSDWLTKLTGIAATKLQDDAKSKKKGALLLEMQSLLGPNKELIRSELTFVMKEGRKNLVSQGDGVDFEDLIETLVPGGDRYYRHDDMALRTENLEDDDHEVPNGHAHCKQGLIASASQTIPIVDGRLMLGRWQRVFFLELDRARDRRVFIQVMGE